MHALLAEPNGNNIRQYRNDSSGIIAVRSVNEKEQKLELQFFRKLISTRAKSLKQLYGMSMARAMVASGF